MGYSHDGTHASTGRLLFGMAERFFLTGDREWFQRVPISQNETLVQALQKAETEATLLTVTGTGHSGPGFHSPENMKHSEDFLGRHLARRQFQGGGE